MEVAQKVDDDQPFRHRI